MGSKEELDAGEAQALGDDSVSPEFLQISLPAGFSYFLSWKAFGSFCRVMEEDAGARSDRRRLKVGEGGEHGRT
jgi:hypothetical protein